VIIAKKHGLRSATLAIAVLIVFFGLVLALATLLLWRLIGLAALLALSRLTALLALPVLVALLPLLLHIVCHEIFLLSKDADFSTPSESIAFHNLVAAGDCRGWEGFWPFALPPSSAAAMR
jgi:hypothetical protein